MTSVLFTLGRCGHLPRLQQEPRALAHHARSHLPCGALVARFLYPAMCLGSGFGFGSGSGLGLGLGLGSGGRVRVRVSLRACAHARTSSDSPPPCVLCAPVRALKPRPGKPPPPTAQLLAIGWKNTLHTLSLGRKVRVRVRVRVGLGLPLPDQNPNPTLK